MRVNILGCGKVARVFARSWSEQDRITVGGVYNRQRAHSEEAVAFIGSGQAVSSLADCAPADVLMIGVSDDQLPNVDALLDSSEVLEHVSLVFHLSGCHPAAALSSAVRRAIPVASLHLLKSVTTAPSTYESLMGAYAALEGSPSATAVLERWCEASGIRTFQIGQNDKSLYHAGNCFLANYVVTLLDAGIRCYEACGISREQACEVSAGMVAEVAARFFARQGENALSGPIRRGDMGVIESHLAALQQKLPADTQLYEALVEQTMRLVESIDPAKAGSFTAYRNRRTPR